MASSWSMWLLLLALAWNAQESQAQNCGMAALNTRIQGGSTAFPGSWPWQVSVHENNGAATAPYACGGTLISSQWVLSAANCIRSGRTYTVFLGRQTQQGPNNNEVMRSVSRTIIHPDYNVSSFMSSDMALLQLSSAVTFTNFIAPICLAGSSSTFSGISCYMTGWGKLMLSDTTVSNELQQIMIPIVSQQQCQTSFQATNITITSPMICAGEQGRGICQGDSGGPLQCQQNSRWIQAGIASFGDICARGVPDVYTRVSSFESWITSQVGAPAQSGLGFVTFNNGASTGNTTTATVNSTSGANHLTLLYLLLLPLLTLLS